MKILVTGGAGFIGSAIARKLIEKGNKVVTVDSLERGHKWAVRQESKFIQGNLLNQRFVSRVFKEKFDGVIHCAGYISVQESVEKPVLYMKNNVVPLSHILRGMLSSGSDNLVFSSSAAVYGNNIHIPIPEDSELIPTNPYGKSKLAAERILANELKIKSVSLRYFNASGALPEENLGENHEPETHLIPVAVSKALKDEPINLFGNDFPTRDGSCVRDYIHISDIADSHILALNALSNGKKLALAYNVGSGSGFSNKEIISSISLALNKKPKIKVKNRRPGDPAILIASIKLIKRDLGFKPKVSDLSSIINSVIAYQKKQEISIIR